MKAGKGVRYWRPFAGVLAVSVLAFTIALEGAPTSKSGRSSVERASGKRLAATAVAPTNAAAIGGQSKADVKTRLRPPSNVSDEGVVTYGRLPEGDLPIMPPVVVDYRNDLPSRLRAEGKLIGPLPLRAEIIEEGGNLSIASTFVCGSGCTWDIECGDDDPCTQDNCDFTPGSPRGSGTCVYALIADGKNGSCPALDGDFCNGREICTGAGYCNNGTCAGGGAAGPCTTDSDCTGVCVDGLCEGGPNSGASCKTSMQCGNVGTCGPPPAGDQPNNYCTTVACVNNRCLGGPDNGKSCPNGIGDCGSFTSGVCDEYRDECAEACTSDAGCQATDGLICNGLETCDGNNVCVPGTNPCGPGATCQEGVCSVSLAPCTRDADCGDAGGTCSLAGPGCFEGRCCFTLVSQPSSCTNNNQCPSGRCNTTTGTCDECVNDWRRTSAQGPSQDSSDQCEERGGLWYATDTGKPDLGAETTCVYPGHHCPQYSSGIAPQGDFPTVLGPINDSCLPVVDSDGVGGPDTPFNAVIDDYWFEGAAATDLYEVEAIRYVGGAARFFVEFYDTDGTFIDDSLPVVVFNTAIAVRTVEFDPPIIVPAKGFVRFRNASQFTPSGSMYLATTDAVDVGTNDPGLLCINDEVVGTGTGSGTCTDPLANTAAASSGILAFEMVAAPVAQEDEPRGACCDPIAGTCQEDVLQWVCQTGTCSNDSNQKCFRSEDCGEGNFCETGVFFGIGQACQFCSIDSDNPFDPCPIGNECINGTCIHQCDAGACCLGDGTCVPGLDTTACSNAGGSFLGFGTDCDPNCCTQPVMTGADNCQDAVVHVVTVPTLNLCVGGTNDGQPCATVAECPGGVACKREKVITISGDNSNATAPDSCFGEATDTNDDPGWWEAFSIDSCAFVRIDHCCTDPIHEPAYRTMYNECNPCSPAIFSRTNPHDILTQQPDQRGAPYCDKDNLWSWFGPLPAGTYWFAVYSAISGHIGPYQLHMTVDACPEASCCHLVAGVPTCTPDQNILDCEDPEGLNGFYLGPPNKSTATSTCVPNDTGGTCDPFSGLHCGTCQTGSCCATAAGGPGTCTDQSGTERQTVTTCNAAGGQYIGGIRCHGGTCDNNPNRSCAEDADCFGGQCVGDADLVSQDSPCPLCEILGANNCHDMTIIAALFDISELTLAELTVADDFIPFSNNINRVCTSGLYVSTLPDSVDDTTGCRLRTEYPMPNPVDKFRIRIYEDGEDDGNPDTPPGLPGDLYQERFASSDGNSWQPEFPRVEGTCDRKTNPDGPNSDLFGTDDLTDEDYTIDISDDPITGLVLDGRKYWLEIMNNMDESPTYDGDPSCIWFINHSDEGNEFAAPGASGVFAGGAPIDLTWCIDQDFTEPDPPEAACCDCEGVCQDNQPLDRCTDNKGGWFINETCADIEDTPDCPAGGGLPDNNFCDGAIPITNYGDPQVATVTIRTNHFCTTTSLPDVAVCTDFSPPSACETKCGDADGDFVGSDLWYSYVPTDDGTLLVNMCQTGTVWDSMFAIYKGPEGTGECPCPTDIASCEDSAYLGPDGAVASDEGCAKAAVGGAGITERDVTAGTCYVFQIGAWGPTGSIPGLGFASFRNNTAPPVFPPELIESDFADPAGARLPRFGAMRKGSVPATAGAGTPTAFKVGLKTLYNTSPGNPDGADVCPDRAPTGQPNLHQYNGGFRYLGAPAAYADDALPQPLKYIAAPLVCTAAEAAVRDWSPTALAADFPDADETRIYFWGDTVVPCSVYELYECTDPANDATCSSPATIYVTAKLADAWPGFGGLANPSFIDINSLVNKYKGYTFAAGGPPEWHALQAGNTFVLSGKLASFLDISKGVDGYKGLPYKEQGPCNPNTSTDSCGNACDPDPN